MELQFLDNLLVRRDYTPNTSLAVQVNHRLAKLTFSELEKVIKENSELNIAKWRVLVVLHHIGSCSQKSIVESSKLDQAQISRALKVLENENFVHSHPSLRDKRSRVFSITSKGNECRAALQSKVDKYHQRITDCLTEEELQLYVSLSTKIANAALRNV
ncbi:MarR family transcriptional regulator [Marinomonas agarivorans]|nr:MarR family transcriptional regulator [Marinomonas agarivorans]